MPIYKSDHLLRFRDDMLRPQGSADQYMVKSEHIFDISVVFEIVPVDVPALVGLDMIVPQNSFADTEHKRLVNLNR